jgi:hypothetical protein
MRASQELDLTPLENAISQLEKNAGLQFQF